MGKLGWLLELGFITFLVLTSCHSENKPVSSKTSPDNMKPLTTQSPKNKVVHKVSLPGWIPETRAEMEKTLGDFLASATVPAGLREPIRGLVVPHAGYEFSGPCAAYAYKSVQGKPYKRVIIMGPDHRIGFNGIAVTKATHYETVLGEIAIDTDLCEKLLAHSKLFRSLEGVDNEHSVAIQVPFIQTVLKDTKIVPLIVGDLTSAEQYQEAAEIIQSLIDDETLVIASSDFTHYGEPHHYVPFKDNIKENLHKLDGGAIELIKEGNLKGFQDYLKETEATICGWRPIVLLMMTLQDTEGVLLHYYTSGDLSNDYSNSVGYAAIALTDYYLSEAEQKTLINLARQTLKLYLNERKTPEVKAGELSNRLRRPRGVFVTLNTRKDHHLRGCIGRLFDPEPLYQGVIDNAVNSAVNDSRFSPMNAAEEPEVEVEISVLSALRRVKGPADIIAGKHGVYLLKGQAGATFLPQVATEQGWNRDTMLSELCEKAGLRPDAWHDPDMKFYVYTAQVIKEETR